MHVRRRDDIDKFFDYDLDPSGRILYIGRGADEDTVDYKMAERAIKGLSILDLAAPGGDKPINIILNSPGGYEYAGLAIYDAIGMCNNFVSVTVLGQAMSMASIILQAADERLITPNARVMIHYGTWGIEDHPKIVQKWMEEGKKMDRWVENLYLEKIREKHPKFRKDKLKRMLDFDTILSAEEAIELGLADKILGGK